MRLLFDEQLSEDLVGLLADIAGLLRRRADALRHFDAQEEAIVLELE